MLYCKKSYLHGVYNIPYETDMDRGYGVEGVSDTISLQFEQGELVSITAHGMHYISEREFEIDIELEDKEVLRLLQKLDGDVIYE